MSHPCTLEYMQEGETSSNQIGGNIEKQKEHQKGSIAHKSQVKAGQSTRIFESESVTERFQTNQVEENPDGDMESKEMNIAIKDNERISFFRILHMALRRRMEIFAQEVSIVGLSYLFKPSSYKVGSIIRKVVWTMLLLFGTGFMVFQIYDRISNYLTYPTTANYQVAYNRSLRFPTVTICPEYLVSKKAFTSVGPETRKLAEIRYPPFWDVEFGESFRALSFSQLEFDWEFFYNHVLINMEDLMLECSFGNRPCNSSDAIQKITTDQGFCLSFNPVTANYVTTQPGANYGLRLVLWVNQSDCYLTMSPAVGFRLAHHLLQPGSVV